MRNHRLPLSSLENNLRTLTSPDCKDNSKRDLMYRKYTNNLNIFENLVANEQFHEAKDLIEAGFDVNKPDLLGDNSTHFFHKHHRECKAQLIQFLVACNADFDAKIN